MKKEKFVYNTHTLTYEKVTLTTKAIFMRIFSFVSSVVVAAVIFLSLFYTYFPSPREKVLLREIDQLEYKFTMVNNQMDMMSKVLNNIQDRDANIHRMMFGMDPIDNDVWNGGTGGHDKFSNLTKYKNSQALLENSLDKIDLLARQMTIQSKSLDTILQLVNNKENFLASLPSIKPVRLDKLASRNIKLLSGFGVRIHPIFKVPKMHAGIDFTAPKGTPIQSTGNGRIARIENKKSGYGNSVLIDHGYGYKTLYAHMSVIDVRVGQTVKRGQKIGSIGSTGTSTAPHCHYEVWYKGEKVNPINYVMDGLTPSEYQDLVEMSSIQNLSFD